MSAKENQAPTDDPEKIKADLEKRNQNDAQNRQRLEKAIGAAQKVVASQKQAQSLKDRALQAVNPKERMRLLKESYQKEVEAHGQSKYAKRLQSGVWQGGAAGGGIGAGVAMGVGAVTGTLVSGLVAVPTTLLGGLVGLGTGAIHGPWFTLPGMGGGDKKDQPMSDEQIREKAMKEAEALDQAVEKGANTVPKPPPGMDEADASEVTNNEEHQDSKQDNADGRATPVAERKKPRKLQVRSGNVQEAELPPERRKPRKLQVRNTGQKDIPAE